MNDIKSKLKDLVEIPSVSRSEKTILDAIANWLSEYGYQVKRGTGWVACVLKSTKISSRALMFNGHIDTVPEGDETMWHSDPFKLKEIQDKLIGLGVSDMKSGCAIMLELSQKLHTDKTQTDRGYDIWFSFVAREEIDGYGAAQFVKWFSANTSYKDVEAVVLEPTDCQFIGIGHRGNMLINIDVSGQSGHASRPEEINSHAIFNALSIKKEITKLNREWQTKYSHPLLGSPSIAVTSIDSGSNNSANQFPSNCTLGVDIRLVPELEDKVEPALKKLLSAYKSNFKHLGEDAKSFWHDKNDGLAKKLQQIEPSLSAKVFSGATDLSYLREIVSAGVIFGPGDSETMHKYNESMTCSNLQMYYNIIIEFVEKYGEIK